MKLQPRWLQRLSVVIWLLFLTIGAARFVGFIFRHYWKGNRLLNVDPTYVNFIRNISKAAIYFVGLGLIISSIPELRAFWVSLLASAGILAAIIGFASQQAFSNIISGLFIVMFRPIRVDDLIEIDMEYKGIVEDITIRHVIIRNTQNQRIVIPNSILSSATIINFSLKDELICSHLEFRLQPQADFPLALSIMRRLGEAHPLCLDQRTLEQAKEGLPIVDTRVVGVTETGVLIRAYVWSETSFLAFDCRCDLYRDILAEFQKKEIPLAYVRV